MYQQPSRHPNRSTGKDFSLLLGMLWDCFCFFHTVTLVLDPVGEAGGENWFLCLRKISFLWRSINQSIPISIACSGLKQREWTPWVNTGQVSSKVAMSVGKFHRSVPMSPLLLVLKSCFECVTSSVGKTMCCKMLAHGGHELQIVSTEAVNK